MTERPPESQPCREEPFLAEYASVFREPEAFASITRSFLEWDMHLDPGIAGRREGPESDDAAHLAADLLAADLVDALPYYPADDPGRPHLIALLRRHVALMGSYIASRDGSQNRASSSFAVYAIAKGVRLGYLPTQDSSIAARAWRDLLRTQTPKTADGAFLLAANEMELASSATSARGRTVMLDAWYNSQQRKNAAEQMEYFHYKWNDFTDNGFSLFAHIWQAHGARTDTLYTAPDAAKLHGAGYYIIVSPDIPKKNPNPHYMNDREASAVVEWVRQGGVLILMENDPPNADLAHLNLLADRFGIHFDDVLHHHIIGEQVEDGRIPVAAGGPLFKRDHTLYMKDTCAISLHGSAQALLRDRGDVVMAIAKSGRGTVFAMVDPWLYNEYTDGRKNPVIYSRFDNFAAGKEFVEWLIQQQPHTKPAPPAGSSRP